MEKPQNGSDGSEIDLVTIKLGADFAKANFDAYMAQGFTREEAFMLTLVAVKAGWSQGSQDKLRDAK
jgi:hypothetical protein